MTAFNILARATPGLSADAAVISAALAAQGHGADIYRSRSRNLDLRAWRLILEAKRLLPGASAPAANIFVERIWPDWLPLAGRNFLVPNQEWCRPADIARLGTVDAILCKTRYAEDIFRRRGLPTAYIGFTSQDRWRDGAEKDHSQFLHMAGRSTQKGTSALIKVWRAHPEWPALTVVTSVPHLARECRAENIRSITRPLAKEDLVALQNRCGVHLCPSEAEGFGHYIGEAMSCGAIVITTDAPPMNELVTPQRGLLAAYKETEPQSLGTNFYVDGSALEAAVERTLRLTTAERANMSRAAREWFLTNKREFESRLPRVVASLL